MTTDTDFKRRPGRPKKDEGRFVHKSVGLTRSQWRFISERAQSSDRSFGWEIRALITAAMEKQL